MWSMTVRELARAVRAGDLSPVEVVEAHLRRVAEVNPAVNAIVQLAPGALDEAAALPPPGDERPLLGVPFTVKDNMETAGIVTAIGVPERATTVPTRDATVVARLRAAGAILLGKTNCPPWGAGIETDNEVYGRTNNPHDVTRTPGGSSGGEAAMVAAGGSPCGVGTDSGGSVRLPAHFCGVAAIKPTAGLVPVTGVLDDSGQIGSLRDPRTQVGLFARSVADLDLLLGVVAGPDVDDAGVVPVPLGDPAAVRVDGLRVALVDDNGRHRPTPETVATVRWAADA
jgi:amidase